jgi:hypothetical protein
MVFPSFLYRLQSELVPVFIGNGHFAYNRRLFLRYLPMPEYCHTLVCEKLDYAPESKLIHTFFQELMAIEAAPTKPKILVSQLSGKFRSFIRTATGQTLIYPLRKSTTFEQLDEILPAMKGLVDYNVLLAGKAPVPLPPIKLDYDKSYDYIVHCCIRPEPVCLSDWHDDIPTKKKGLPKSSLFGQGGVPVKDRTGYYFHPKTHALMEIPKAGFARFWIEFEFGKQLVPDFKDDCEILHPAVMEVAKKVFGVKFIQVFHWV